MVDSPEGLRPGADLQGWFGSQLEGIELASNITMSMLDPLIDSSEATPEDWQAIIDDINAHTDEADAFLVLHGTDTMAYSAAALSYALASMGKPVVLTGAMRPATALSADGPLNIFDAVCLAASPAAHGQGVLVTLNGDIHSARDMEKVHTTAVQAFASPDVGVLGRMEDGTPHFRRRVLTRHTRESEFDLAGVTALPYVPILYGHAGADVRLARAAIESGAAGIVHAGTGNGSIHEALLATLAAAAGKGIGVVRASRTGAGAVLFAESAYAEAGFIDADTLPPAKARILLALALLKTNDRDEIRRMFHEY